MDKTATSIHFSARTSLFLKDQAERPRIPLRQLSMVPLQNEDSPTRRSLLTRLKNWDDQEGWNEFFQTYWRLIYSTAIRAGLTNSEAEEVVQETIISVSKNMPTFRYDPKIGSFKNWLLTMTHWRILDQFKNRMPGTFDRQPQTDDPRTATIDRIPDTAEGLKDIWEDEWRRSLLTAATENVKQTANPAHYQLFELYVLQKWSASKICENLHVNIGRIYLAKHRISRLIKKEVRRLETQMT
jgi:RNA polymerase sigma factor (sigma-70 family)